jgi:uncharacterized protein (DUF305 family)
MHAMHEATSRVSVTGDVNRDFIALMVPHHQAAIDMARTYLESGNDPELRQLAEHIVADQQAEITQMETLARAHSSNMSMSH